VSFAFITLCVASERVIVDSAWKLLDTPSYMGCKGKVVPVL
jgi:hypothetical protein